MLDITITRNFPIINDYVIMPDYGPSKIPLHVAEAIPGIFFKNLTNVTRASAIRRSQAFLETAPGYTECCELIPANDISEILKEHTPPYPPREDVPPYDPGYTPTPYDPDDPYTPPGPCDTPRCPQGVLTAVWDMPFFGGTTPCDCMGASGGTALATLEPTGDCSYFGYVNVGGTPGLVRATIYWDSQLCVWVLVIECLKNRMQDWDVIWTGWAYPGPTGTYWQAGLHCADMAYLDHIDVGNPV
jgi:hypothetical protein